MSVNPDAYHLEPRSLIPLPAVHWAHANDLIFSKNPTYSPTCDLLMTLIFETLFPFNSFQK